MRLDPHSAVNFYLLGLAHFSMGQMEKAVPLFERAVRLNPFNVSWKAPLAAAYAYTGHNQEAQAALADFGGALFSLENIMDTWPFKDAKVAERFGVGLVKAGVCCEGDLSHYLDGLRKAGLTE